jgi:hypothetical protein
VQVSEHQGVNGGNASERASVSLFCLCLSLSLLSLKYNNDNRAGAVFDIPTMCSILESTGDAFSGLVSLWQQYNQATGQTECTDISYMGSVQDLRATSAGRSWTYQT